MYINKGKINKERSSHERRHTSAHARTHTRTNTLTLAHTHTHTHTDTHTHTHTRTLTLLQSLQNNKTRSSPQCRDRNDGQLVSSQVSENIIITLRTESTQFPLFLPYLGDQKNIHWPELRIWVKIGHHDTLPPKSDVMVRVTHDTHRGRRRH